MNTSIKEQVRFNARLPKEQKVLFEKAAYLGGYRSLTDFIIHTAQEKAKEIINKETEFITSERDAEFFFDALINPKQPSETLKKAFDEHTKIFSNL